MRATGSLVCHDTAPINLRSQTTLVGQHVADQHAALGSIGAIPILRLSGVFGPRNMLRIVPTTPVAATGFSLERYQIVTTLLPNTRSQHVGVEPQGQFTLLHGIVVEECDPCPK